MKDIDKNIDHLFDTAKNEKIDFPIKNIETIIKNNSTQGPSGSTSKLLTTKIIKIMLITTTIVTFGLLFYPGSQEALQVSSDQQNELALQTENQSFKRNSLEQKDGHVILSKYEDDHSITETVEYFDTENILIQETSDFELIEVEIEPDDSIKTNQKSNSNLKPMSLTIYGTDSEETFWDKISTLQDAGLNIQVKKVTFRKKEIKKFRFTLVVHEECCHLCTDIKFSRSFNQISFDWEVENEMMSNFHYRINEGKAKYASNKN